MTYRGDSYAHKFLAVRQKKPSYAAFWMLIRTAQQLNRDKRYADARFLLELGHGRIPELFTGGRRPEDIVFDPGAHPFKRTPTRWENYAGVTDRRNADLKDTEGDSRSIVR